MTGLLLAPFVIQCFTGVTLLNAGMKLNGK
jgi:hypothetical protein